VAPPAFYFNLAVAPAPVRARYERRLNGSQYVRGSDLLPFDDTGVDMNYYGDAVTGEYFILRDGTLFEIKPQNEKGLFPEPPKCMDTSGPGFRHWYDLFMKHRVANGYYVHPYILFRRIDACSLSVWTLLNKDKMFPRKSAFGTLVRKTCGKGHEALRRMIMQINPLFGESPGDHVRSSPNQSTGKTLTLVGNSDMSLV
jgi:hypothetical protein